MNLSFYFFFDSNGSLSQVQWRGYTVMLAAYMIISCFFFFFFHLVVVTIERP